MSDEPYVRGRSRGSSSSGSNRALVIPVLVAAVGIWVLALSEIGQTWETEQLASRFDPPARVGDLVSVTLLNGQVYFGTLDAISRTTISLRDVFFAQAAANRSQDQEAGDRPPTILRRQDNEWTQASAMAIPVDRLAYMENVGKESRIAHIISDTRSQPSGLPVGRSSNAPPAPAGQSSPPKP